MPELPEVETIARELRDKLVGEKFTDIKCIWERSFVAENDLTIVNRQIFRVDRKGKYLIFALDNYFLVIHLRMTGQLIVSNSPPEDNQYLRIQFKFKSGKHLLFYDLRKFGRIYLAKNPDRVLINVGIDAISKTFTIEKFMELLNGRNIRIKTFLLDQRFIAGLGNIYIDESLFEAKIHPEALVRDLNNEQRIKLFEAIGNVLRNAIKNMGTTISDYKTTGGGFGDNQGYLKVYQKQNQPCIICHTLIEKIKLNGRGTHFCPQCQSKSETT